jgi:hypothetical protein
MKKILALVSFLVVVGACAAPPTNREAASTTNLATPSKSPTRMSDDEVIARQKAVLEAIKKKDYDGFANILASDQIYVSSDGVYDKAENIKNVKEVDLTDVTFSDWKVLPLDKDAVVVTYTMTIKGQSKGRAIPSPLRASSALVNRNGKWLEIYHQDCEVKPAPPPPANTNKPAKATASPTPMAAQASTGADPIANEKMVWDALKSKNFDAFAAFLASDSLEVEPEGVHDKAGSVKTVSQFDASKAALSEWKVVKFDDDASLVTYLVKIPGSAPDGERHSTIWIDRGGKWLALFHHGTPVMKAPAEKPAAKKM